MDDRILSLQCFATYSAAQQYRLQQLLMTADAAACRQASAAESAEERNFGLNRPPTRQNEAELFD